MMSFRIDDCLARMLRSMPNRSAFIREAVQQALGHCCPICHGSGVLPEPPSPGGEESRPLGAAWADAVRSASGTEEAADRLFHLWGLSDVAAGDRAVVAAGSKVEVAASSHAGPDSTH